MRNVFVNCLTIPSDAVTIVSTAVFFNNDNTERPIDGMMLCMPKHMIKIQTLADFYFFLNLFFKVYQANETLAKFFFKRLSLILPGLYS